MLGETHDYGLRQLAALHNVSLDDIHEVIKEGDAKGWDDSPRSNAVRDGQRVYPKEMSEGWKLRPQRRLKLRQFSPNCTTLRVVFRRPSRK